MGRRGLAPVLTPVNDFILRYRWQALLLLGLGVLFEVGRRVVYGAEPASGWMIGTAAVSLIVNMSVLRMLAPLKSGEVHLRATWIFTRADIVANVGVIVAGIFVAGVLVGADTLSRAVGVPAYIAEVVVGASLIAVLVAGLLTQYRVRWK